MDISDVIFDSSIRLETKQSILSLIQRHSLTGYTPILTPTDKNDDINGSQHAANGGTDFTYRDATWDEVSEASSLGVYDYFSNYAGEYTGHYYQGDGSHFRALVVNPPTYAIEEVI